MIRVLASQPCQAAAAPPVAAAPATQQWMALLQQGGVPAVPAPPAPQAAPAVALTQAITLRRASARRR